MRTITIPRNSAAAIHIRFNYRFGKLYQGLGLHYNKLNPSTDSFLYSRSDFSPAALETAVAAYAAPERNVKSFTFCDLSIGRYSFGGLSFCFVSDVYDRQTGERLALRRALEQMARMEGTTGITLDTAIRRRIWEEWLKSYKAAAREWEWNTVEVKDATPPTLPTGRIHGSKPALQDIPRKPGRPR